MPGVVERREHALAAAGLAYARSLEQSNSVLPGKLGLRVVARAKKWLARSVLIAATD